VGPTAGLNVLEMRKICCSYQAGQSVAWRLYHLSNHSSVLPEVTGPLQELEWLLVFFIKRKMLSCMNCNLIFRIKVSYLVEAS
jgi:hypothetical protein